MMTSEFLHPELDNTPSTTGFDHSPIPDDESMVLLQQEAIEDIAQAHSFSKSE
jgi:hypothetical protein